MSALCTALTFPTPRGTQITPLIASLPWEALLDGTDRAAESSQTRPRASARKNIFISLCCSDSVAIQRFWDDREIPPAHQRCGDGGVSTALPRPCQPLPSQPVLGLVRQFGLHGSCPGGDSEFSDQRSCQRSVLPESGELSISQLRASLPAAGTHEQPRSESLTASFCLYHPFLQPLASLNPSGAVSKRRAPPQPKRPLGVGKVHSRRANRSHVLPKRKNSPGFRGLRRSQHHR